MEEQVELAKFFERDIIEFLDQKKAESMGAGNSLKNKYYSKFESAINASDINKAEKILEDVLTKFNSIDRNSPYKTIIYEDILEILEFSKKEAALLKGDNDLIKILNLIHEQDIESSMPNTIQAIEKIKVERAQKRIEEESKYYEEKAKLDKAIKNFSQDLFINLRKKDLKSSIETYKRLKEIFERYPSRFEEDKQDIYGNILAFYMQIKRLKEELNQKKEISKKLEIIKEARRTSIEQDKPSELEKIKKIVDEIKEDAKHKDFHAARGKIIDLREIASHVHDKHIRIMLESKINTMNQKLEFVRRALEHKT